jgi:hypothetical protein
MGNGEKSARYNTHAGSFSWLPPVYRGETQAWGNLYANLKNNWKNGSLRLRFGNILPRWEKLCLHQATQMSSLDIS